MGDSGGTPTLREYRSYEIDKPKRNEISTFTSRDLLLVLRKKNLLEEIQIISLSITKTFITYIHDYY